MNGIRKENFKENNKRTKLPDWYLPSGYVQTQESFEEAIARVIKEKCGAEIDPVLFNCMLVEEIGPFYFRFTYTMKKQNVPFESLVKVSEVNFKKFLFYFFIVSIIVLFL